MSTPMQTMDGRRRIPSSVAVSCAAVLAVVFLGASFAEAAQFNATVRGKVTDADGNPLAGVTITIVPRYQNPENPVEPIVVQTLEDGQYQARNVRLGETMISYELEGYEPVLRERPLRAGPLRIDVTMEPVEVPDAVLRANVANEAYQAGRDAFDAGDYEETVAQMEAAAEVMEGTPDSAESLGYIYALMGRAYLEQRMFEEASEAYRKWVEYHPDDSTPLVELAQALTEMGDQEAASTYFEAALEIDPDDAMTHYNVGVIMVNVGNLEDGIRELERAIELQPEYPLAYKNLGYAYARTEEYAKAVSVFETYLEQSPDADDAPQIRDFVVALKEMIG